MRAAAATSLTIAKQSFSSKNRKDFEGGEKKLVESKAKIGIYD